MALVMTIRVGEDFYVEKKRFVVSALHGPLAFSLKDEEGRVWHITDQEGTEIVQDVFVSAGDDPPSSTARVAVSAPRSILVIRGEKVRAATKKNVRV